MNDQAINQRRRVKYKLDVQINYKRPTMNVREKGEVTPAVVKMA